MTTNSHTSDDPPARGRAPLRSLLWVARAAQVRLRFLIALVVAFFVVGRWDDLRTSFDRWTAPAARDPAMGAVSADTEYFCPMDPGVLADWPGKCPICHMALVRRKKGDMGPLPNGVVARVQFSPQRVQLGGIRTSAVAYSPLAREIRLMGRSSVEGGRTTITLDVDPSDEPWLQPGRQAEVSPDPSDGSSPSSGRVISVEEGHRVIVETAANRPQGQVNLVVVRVPMDEREPFRSMPSGPPPISAGETRTVYICPEHPDEPKLISGRCPKEENPLQRVPLDLRQKLIWWCPMHRQVTADREGTTCSECGGMPLVAHVMTYRPEGQVLTVPESAVIDTGSRTLVYVESMPGTFDGVEVKLGPRCGEFYPVVEGLESGQRVAASGAFLVDAETRLNPSLAASYFGSTPRKVDPASPSSADTLDLAELSTADRALVVAQSICPVTGKPLGSMGTPVRVDVKGRAVFVCCDGCSDPLKDAPDQYLSRLKPASVPAHHP